MIHRNRGNRRWIDKRKRRHKYNLAKKICDSIKGVLGKYDKGKIHDQEDYKKTNSKTASKGYVSGGKLGNNYSYADKKKVESCNDRIKDYERWFDEDMYDAVIADCEDWHKTFEDEVNE